MHTEPLPRDAKPRKPAAPKPPAPAAAPAAAPGSTTGGSHGLYACVHLARVRVRVRVRVGVGVGVGVGVRVGAGVVRVRPPPLRAALRAVDNANRRRFCKLPLGLSDCDHGVEIGLDLMHDDATARA